MEKLVVIGVFAVIAMASSVELGSLSVRIEEKLPTHKCNQTLENIQVSFQSAG
jgi:hypothetical protein